MILQWKKKDRNGIDICHFSKLFAPTLYTDDGSCRQDIFTTQRAYGNWLAFAICIAFGKCVGRTGTFAGYLSFGFTRCYATAHATYFAYHVPCAAHDQRYLYRVVRKKKIDARQKIFLSSQCSIKNNAKIWLLRLFTIFISRYLITNSSKILLKQSASRLETAP